MSKLRSFKFELHGKKFTVVCTQGESFEKCYEDLKKHFPDVKPAKSGVAPAGGASSLSKLI